MLIHVLGIFTLFVGPLIIWLIKKDESAYVDHHGKQALNFQLMITAIHVASAILGMTVILALLSCLIAPAAFVVSIVFSIMAAMAASKGEWYRYPLSLPLIK